MRSNSPPPGHEDANQTASFQTPATVWLVGDGGRPKPVAVRLGVSDDNGAELLEGTLAEDQQVIIGIANSQRQRSYFGLRLGF
jgi:HlyD family secretion protein